MTRSVGVSVDMEGAVGRVTGRVEYALNIEVPHMAHAKLLRSPIPHARVTSLDTTRAERVPGVLGILTARDLDRPGGPSSHFGPVLIDQPVVAGEKVRFAGDIVAAVAAETEEIADAALMEIDVEYDELPIVDNVGAALEQGAAMVHDEPPPANDLYPEIVLLGRGGNVCNKFQLRSGDIEDGFRQSDVVLEGVYKSPTVQHVPFEPHVVLASWTNESLSITSSTQSPFAVRDAVAHLFNIPFSKVRVIVPPLGGGFGAKTYIRFEPVVAALSWKVHRPVKLVLSREEEFLSLTRHAAEIHLRTGALRDGTLLARQVTAYFDAGAYADISPRLIKSGGYSCIGPYVIPNVQVDSYAIYTNKPPSGAFRGYGVSQAAWAHEQQMDEIAQELGIDALKIRELNLLTEGSRFVTGETIYDAHWLEVLSQSAEAIGWNDDVRQPKSANGRASGKGLAVILKSTLTPSTSNAELRLDADGSLQVKTSAVEMGQGAHTIVRQIAADAVGLPLGHVGVTEPDTQFTPYDQTTSSSRTTTAVGGAVHIAGQQVREQLLALAADVMEVSVEDLMLADGSIAVAGVPDSAQSISAIMSSTRTGSISGHGEVKTEGGLDPLTGQGVASVHWHQGAAAAVVEVDLETGKVYVTDVHTSVYAGRVVNPKLAKAQVHGSASFAIGLALYEEMAFVDGILTNANLSDYSILSMGDLPRRLEIHLLEDASGAGAVHGIGETALPPVLAAVANAVANAIGERVRTAPLTPERVLHALQQQPQATMRKT